MGWWVFIITGGVVGALGWKFLTAPHWQEQHLLLPWQEEAYSLQLWRQWLAQKFCHLKQTPLHPNRPGTPGQIDRERASLLQRASEHFAALQQLHLDALIHQAQAPPNTFVQRLIGFARWRWYSKQAVHYLHQAEQLLHQAQMAKRRLRQLQGQYHQHCAAAIEFLAKFSPEDPLSRAIYPRMFELVQIARQDAGDLYGFGLGRAYVLLNLLDLGRDMLNLTAQGSALAGAMDLDVLLPQLADSAQTVQALFAATHPLPQDEKSLQDLQNKFNQTLEALEQTKKHLAYLHTQKTKLAEALAWLKHINAAHSGQHQMCQKSWQYQTRCREIWGPERDDHAWWQEALSAGIPWELCYQLYQQAARLQYAAKKETIKESQISTFVEQVGELKAIAVKIQKSFLQVQKTFQQYHQQKQILADRLGNELTALLEQQARQLEKISAPTAAWQEHKKHQETLKILQKEASHPLTPAHAAALLQQADALEQDIFRTTHWVLAELKQVRQKLHQNIITLDNINQKITLAMRTPPPIPSSCCQAELVAINNKQVDTWQLTDNFTQLYSYEHQITIFIEQAQNSLQEIQSQRKKWEALKKESKNIRSELSTLGRTIAQHYKNASWDLVIQEYEELLEQVASLQDALGHWMQRPEDQTWLPDAIRELSQIHQRAKQQMPHMRERLRNLVIQEQEFIKSSVSGSS